MTILCPNIIGILNVAGWKGREPGHGEIVVLRMGAPDVIDAGDP
jgi:hypothetical protein